MISRKALNEQRMGKHFILVFTVVSLLHELRIPILKVVQFLIKSHYAQDARSSLPSLY